jgi:CRISPR-associated protein Cas2
MSGDTTLYVIAYDIPNDKRRGKIHKILSGFGAWTQFSLFECFLNKRQLVAMRAQLDEIMHSDEDSVRIYPLCKMCQSTVETIGSPEPHEPQVYFG